MSDDDLLTREPATTTAAVAVTTSASRWMGVGYSSDPDALVAGAEAARSAVQGRDTALLVVFCTVDYDLERLLAGVASTASEKTAIVGCSTLGQLVETDDASGEPKVVVSALGAGFEIRTSVAQATGRNREAGMEAAACLSALTRPERTLLLLCDGLVGEQHEVVRGTYAQVGAAVPIVGGCAGDELTYSRTFQFHGDARSVAVLSNAVVGVAIGSDAPIGHGLSHGWRKRGEPMVVTRSSGGHILELNDEPALDVYLRCTGGDISLAEDSDRFRVFSFNNPLGLSRRSGEDIRVLHHLDTAARSLVCLADVPQGALAWLMETDPDTMIAGGVESCRQAIDMLGDNAPVGVMTFDCGVRKVLLGEEGCRREVAALTDAAQGAPLAGFYTYGEIARVRGARGMHHLTVVSLAFA